MRRCRSRSLLDDLDDLDDFNHLDDLYHLDHLNGLDDLDIRLFYFPWQGGDPVRAHQQGRLHRSQRLQGNGRGLWGEKTTGEDKTCLVWLFHRKILPDLPLPSQDPIFLLTSGSKTNLYWLNFKHCGLRCSGWTQGQSWQLQWGRPLDRPSKWSLARVRLPRQQIRGELTKSDEKRNEMLISTGIWRTAKFTSGKTATPCNW